MPESDDQQLLEMLDWLRNTMVAVATHVLQIQEVNDTFRARYGDVAAALSRRRIANPLPYADLWDWYGRWKRNMPTYQSRREYVSELFTPLRNRIVTGRSDGYEPTGWARVDRVLDSLGHELADARTEEQFQSIGLHCREALISLAQAVYDPARHPSLDGVAISDSDAKRMLDSFLAVELPGESNHEARAHARSALKLADAVQHRRTATFRDSALCLEATTSVTNLIAIIAGRRDQRPPTC